VEGSEILDREEVRVTIKRRSGESSEKGRMKVRKNRREWRIGGRNKLTEELENKKDFFSLR